MTNFKKITWEGDNRIFVIEYLLPHLYLPEDIRQVIRWAYGYDGGFDGSGESYEQRSDGSSVVGDILLLGKLMKDPVGVGHDVLFELHDKRMPTPDGHYWTLRETNNWYQRGYEAFGHPKRGKLWRIGLFIGSWQPWVFGK